MFPYLFPLVSPSLPLSLSHPSRWSQSTGFLESAFNLGNELQWEMIPARGRCHAGCQRNKGKRLGLSEPRSSQWDLSELGFSSLRGHDEAGSHRLEEATQWEEQLVWERVPLLLREAAPGGMMLTQRQPNRKEEAPPLSSCFPVPR